MGWTVSITHINKLNAQLEIHKHNNKSEEKGTAKPKPHQPIQKPNSKTKNTQANSGTQQQM